MKTLLLFIATTSLFADQCKEKAIKLIVGEDHRLHMVVKGGKTLPAKIASHLMTSAAKPWWLRGMSDAIERAARDPRNIPSPDKMLDALSIGYNAKGGKIPEKGPLVIIANPPRFGPEGLGILSHVLKTRPDVKLVMNEMMLDVPGFKEFAIGVNKEGSKDERRDSTKQIGDWLREGHVVIIFPAGQPSRRTGDVGWSKSVSLLARRYKAPTLPVYVEGHPPGFWFRMTDRFSSKPIQSVYPMEILRQKGQTINLTFGEPVPPEKLKSFGDDEKAVQYLRDVTYGLGTSPP